MFLIRIRKIIFNYALLSGGLHLDTQGYASITFRMFLVELVFNILNPFPAVKDNCYLLSLFLMGSAVAQW